MKHFSLLALSVMTLVGCGNGTQAQDISTAAPSTEVRQELPILSGPDVWTLIPSASQLTFTATHSGETFTGSFSNFDAAIRLSTEAPVSGEITVVVGIESVDAADDDRNANLVNKDWFAVKSNPFATYRSTDIKRQADGTYIAAGLLSIKGITKPVDLNFTLDILNNEAIATGQTQFSRQIFNLGEGSDFQDESWVKFPVEVNFVIKAKRAPQ